MIKRGVFLFTFFWFTFFTFFTFAQDKEKESILLSQLNWLSGYWTSKSSQEVFTEELWLPAKGNIMIGVHRDSKKQKAFFEYLRIEKTAQGIFYFASPMGSKTTPFKLIEISNEKATFFNGTNDFPQKIIYQLISPQKLKARIEGNQGKEFKFKEWTWTRSEFSKASKISPAMIPQSDKLAEKKYSELEEKLLKATTIGIQFSITSKGPFISSLEGSLLLEQGNKVRLMAKGIFGKQKVELSLNSDGKTISGGNLGKTFNKATPKELNKAIILGITRMGLLHNLAMLSGGRPPDKTNGTIEKWVKAINFAPVQETQEGQIFHFKIEVAQRNSGEVNLRLSPKELLPAKRKQTVHFSNGSMEVLETYHLFLLNPSQQEFEEKLKTKE